MIGKEIKDRRMADFQDIMLSRLPEDFNIEQNDPAVDNAEIEEVLIANERDATLKTEQVCFTENRSKFSLLSRFRFSKNSLKLTPIRKMK